MKKYDKQKEKEIQPVCSAAGVVKISHSIFTCRTNTFSPAGLHKIIQRNFCDFFKSYVSQRKSYKDGKSPVFQRKISQDWILCLVSLVTCKHPYSTTQFMNFASKRKRDEHDSDVKKIKNDIEGEVGLATSNEWPVYSHPEGGIVKITPWGCLRQFPHSEDGHLVTKFEDSTFMDYQFQPQRSQYEQSQYQQAYLQSQQQSNMSYESMPSTPQSLYQSQPSTGVSARGPTAYTQNPSSPIKLSPSDEAEGYVMTGYQMETPPCQEQYGQEHEHYFGMEDEYQ